jgi:hypothetical protein
MLHQKKQTKGFTTIFQIAFAGLCSEKTTAKINKQGSDQAS